MNEKTTERKIAEARAALYRIGIEVQAALGDGMPDGLDAHGLAEARAKLNPELGMPEGRGNVETGDLTRCPCPSCGNMLNVCDYYTTIRPGQELHCEHCNARLRVEYATVTLSEEAGRAQG